MHSVLPVHENDPLDNSGVRVIPTIAHAVKRLVECGYVVREQCPVDKRCYHLALTTKAEALVPSIVRTMEEWDAALASGFTDEERGMLESYLQRMATSAEGACARQKPQS